MNLRRLSIMMTPLALGIFAACTTTTTIDNNPNDNNRDGGNPPVNTNDGGAGEDAGEDAEPTPTYTEYEATLTGAEAVPVVATTANGQAKFQLMEDGVTLKYDITHNVAGATDAYLNTGYVGENGPVMIHITPFGPSMKGQLELTSEQAEALTSGKVYVSITTPQNQAGEVRGQVVQPGSLVFLAKLTGSQIVPANNAASTGMASIILNGSKDTIRYHFTTDAPLNDAHIHRAIGAINGPVAYPVGPAAATIDGTISITSNDAAELEAGRLYIDAHSQAWATGEIRGQILRPAEQLYTAILSGTNQVPSVSTAANGGAQFILSADKKTMRYEVVANTMIVTAAKVHIGQPGQNGNVLFNMTLGAQGARGEQTVSASDIALFDANGVYTNVYSATFPNGEIRGQNQKKVSNDR